MKSPFLLCTKCHGFWKKMRFYKESLSRLTSHKSYHSLKLVLDYYIKTADTCSFILCRNIHTDMRRTFIISIIKQDRSFLQLSSFERLKYLMTSKEPSIIQATMKYITDMINQRKSILKSPDAHREILITKPFCCLHASHVKLLCLTLLFV